jgi:hypothetical protein
VLRTAYQNSVQNNLLLNRSLYFMVDASIPNSGSGPTLDVYQPGQFPWVDYTPEQLAIFLEDNVGPNAALSATDFLIIDTRAEALQGVIYVHVPAPGTLCMVRLILSAANDLPIAVNVGTMGFDEIAEALPNVVVRG